LGKYNFAIYLGKFLGAFCILYFGTEAIIGITVPGGYYIDFVHRYFDYISALRKSLLYGAQFVLSLGGYHSNIKNAYILAFENGRGIRLVYGCLGYGIVSFWLAFVFANKGSAAKKICWMAGGFLAIWLINVARISLFLLAINKGWAMPLGIDHHTWFDIAAYGCVFLMIYVFDRSGKAATNKENETA
jgi:exosortase/archaeosortase family protein